MALQIIYAPNIYTAHCLSQHKPFYAPVGGFHAMKIDESHYTGLDLLDKVWTVLAMFIRHVFLYNRNKLLL